MYPIGPSRVFVVQLWWRLLWWCDYRRSCGVVVSPIPSVQSRPVPRSVLYIVHVCVCGWLLCVQLFASDWAVPVHAVIGVVVFFPAVWYFISSNSFEPFLCDQSPLLSQGCTTRRWCDAATEVQTNFDPSQNFAMIVKIHHHPVPRLFGNTNNNKTILNLVHTIRCWCCWY